MPTVQMYRFFDLPGKLGVRPYVRLTKTIPKAQANSIAKSYRKTHGGARVIKAAGGWVVFVKQGK